MDSDPAPTGAGRVRHGFERRRQAGAGVGHDLRVGREHGGGFGAGGNHARSSAARDLVGGGFDYPLA